jgi:hypothetical protein
MMTRRLHGITSFLWIAIAAVIAARTASRTSASLEAAYLAICVTSPWVIVYAFCARCTCKGGCAHVLPGRIAQIMERKAGPYHPAELLATSLALLLLTGFPLLWLWRYPGPLLAFGLLNAVALLQIRLVSCRTCEHAHCPLRISYREGNQG